MSRDKGQPSRFQNKFYATLNLHSNLSKHIPEIERQSYTLYREKSTHASTKTRKLEFVCLELASFTTNAKQNEKQRKSVKIFTSDARSTSTI